MKYPERRGIIFSIRSPRTRCAIFLRIDPTLTESPYTVDAGHVQWEIDLFNATYDHAVNQGESLTTDSRIWGGLNFKVGLLDQVDLQTIVPMHVDQRTQSSAVGQSQRKRCGDLTTRLKINLWGNDGGPRPWPSCPL